MNTKFIPFQAAALTTSLTALGQGCALPPPLTVPAYAYGTLAQGERAPRNVFVAVEGAHLEGYSKKVGEPPRPGVERNHWSLVWGTAQRQDLREASWLFFERRFAMSLDYVGETGDDGFWGSRFLGLKLEDGIGSCLWETVCLTVLPLSAEVYGGLPEGIGASINAANARLTIEMERLEFGLEGGGLLALSANTSGEYYSYGPWSNFSDHFPPNTMTITVSLYPGGRN